MQYVVSDNLNVNPSRNNFVLAENITKLFDVSAFLTLHKKRVFH